MANGNPLYPDPKPAKRPEAPDIRNSPNGKPWAPWPRPAQDDSRPMPTPVAPAVDEGKGAA